jgi:hypothetical protein
MRTDTFIFSAGKDCTLIAKGESVRHAQKWAFRPASVG